MTTFKKAGLAHQLAFFALFAGVFLVNTPFRAIAQSNSPSMPAASTNLAKTPGTKITGRPARAPIAKQADVASTNAVFGTVTTNDLAYKSAVKAHSLDDAFKLVGKEGAFTGTVAKVFETRGLDILEFDQDFKTALTAVVRGTNFANFPVLTNLVGKSVLVTGSFIDYRGKAEIVLEKPDQIKVVK